MQIFFSSNKRERTTTTKKKNRSFYCIEKTKHVSFQSGVGKISNNFKEYIPTQEHRKKIVFKIHSMLMRTITVLNCPPLRSKVKIV